MYLGDYKLFLNNNDEDDYRTYEVKAEEVLWDFCGDGYQTNIPLEVFSNLAIGRLGWFFRCEADVLLYHHLVTNELIRIPLPGLHEWVKAGGLKNIPIKAVYLKQPNDTRNCCVPIENLIREVSGCKAWIVNPETGELSDHPKYTPILRGEEELVIEAIDR